MLPRARPTDTYAAAMPPSDPAPRVLRAASRFRTDTEWLSSAHSFSFGPHYDPDNVGHGRLMVSNHESVRSGAGFEDHPHADAEIVTWVLSGSLVHTDSAGHRAVAHRGLAQRMSAGAGIVHAEVNDGYVLDPSLPATAVEYVQMWVRPDAPGGPSSFQQTGYAEADLTAGWMPVASGHEPEALVRIGSAATLWVTVLGPGVHRDVPGGDDVHLYLARGRCVLDGAGELVVGDAVRFHRSDPVGVTGSVDGAELLVWQMDRER